MPRFKVGPQLCHRTTTTATAINKERVATLQQLLESGPGDGDNNDLAHLEQVQRGEREGAQVAQQCLPAWLLWRPRWRRGQEQAL